MRFFILLVAIGAPACASSPGASVDPTRQRDILFDETRGSVRANAYPLATAVAIQATPDQTWAAIVSAYSAVGVELKYLNRPVGELGNRDIKMTRTLRAGPVARYIDCGSDPFEGPLAGAHPVRASLVTRMWQDGASSRIQTLLSATMKKAGFATVVNCSSTGLLERFIADTVSKLSAQPSP